MRFQAFASLLEEQRYQLHRSRGSHKIFKRRSGGSLAVSVHSGAVPFHRVLYLLKEMREAGGDADGIGRSHAGLLRLGNIKTEQGVRAAMEEGSAVSRNRASDRADGDARGDGGGDQLGASVASVSTAAGTAAPSPVRDDDDQTTPTTTKAKGPRHRRAWEPREVVLATLEPAELVELRAEAARARQLRNHNNLYERAQQLLEGIVEGGDEGSSSPSSTMPSEDEDSRSEGEETVGRSEFGCDRVWRQDFGRVDDISVDLSNIDCFFSSSEFSASTAASTSKDHGSWWGMEEQDERLRDLIFDIKVQEILLYQELFSLYLAWGFSESLCAVSPGDARTEGDESPLSVANSDSEAGDFARGNTPYFVPFTVRQLFDKLDALKKQYLRTNSSSSFKAQIEDLEANILGGTLEEINQFLAQQGMLISLLGMGAPGRKMPINFSDAGTNRIIRPERVIKVLPTVLELVVVNLAGLLHLRPTKRGRGVPLPRGKATKAGAGAPPDGLSATCKRESGLWCLSYLHQHLWRVIVFGSDLFLCRMESRMQAGTEADYEAIIDLCEGLDTITAALRGQGSMSDVFNDAYGPPRPCADANGLITRWTDARGCAFADAADDVWQQWTETESRQALERHEAVGAKPYQEALWQALTEEHQADGEDGMKIPAFQRRASFGIDLVEKFVHFAHHARHFYQRSARAYLAFLNYADIDLRQEMGVGAAEAEMLSEMAAECLDDADEPDKFLLYERPAARAAKTTPLPKGSADKLDLDLETKPETACDELLYALQDLGAQVCNNRVCARYVRGKAHGAGFKRVLYDLTCLLYLRFRALRRLALSGVSHKNSGQGTDADFCTDILSLFGRNHGRALLEMLFDVAELFQVLDLHEDVPLPASSSWKSKQAEDAISECDSSEQESEEDEANKVWQFALRRDCSLQSVWRPPPDRAQVEEEWKAEEKRQQKRRRAEMKKFWSRLGRSFHGQDGKDFEDMMDRQTAGMASGLSAQFSRTAWQRKRGLLSQHLSVGERETEVFFWYYGILFQAVGEALAILRNAETRPLLQSSVHAVGTLNQVALMDFLGRDALFCDWPCPRLEPKYERVRGVLEQSYPWLLEDHEAESSGPWFMHRALDEFALNPVISFVIAGNAALDMCGILGLFLPPFGKKRKEFSLLVNRGKMLFVHEERFRQALRSCGVGDWKDSSSMPGEQAECGFGQAVEDPQAAVVFQKAASDAHELFKACKADKSRIAKLKALYGKKSKKFKILHKLQEAFFAPGAAIFSEELGAASLKTQTTSALSETFSRLMEKFINLKPDSTSAWTEAPAAVMRGASSSSSQETRESAPTGPCSSSKPAWRKDCEPFLLSGLKEHIDGATCLHKAWSAAEALYISAGQAEAVQMRSVFSGNWPVDAERGGTKREMQARIDGEGGAAGVLWESSMASAALANLALLQQINADILEKVLGGR